MRPKLGRGAGGAPTSRAPALGSGRSLNEVSRLLDCAPSSVMRWRDTREAGGDEALRVRFSPGRPPKLSARERRRLVALLRRGAQAHGYATDLWTTTRVARAIFREFRVRYHRAHVVACSTCWAGACRSRASRARAQRGADRTREARDLAAHPKEAARLGAHLVFVESGFLGTPNVRRTGAPRGQAPLLRHRQRRERISVISGPSVSPRRWRCGLYFLLSPQNIQPPRGVRLSSGICSAISAAQ
jgi:transposase